MLFRYIKCLMRSARCRLWEGRSIPVKQTSTKHNLASKINLGIHTMKFHQGVVHNVKNFLLFSFLPQTLPPLLFPLCFDLFVVIMLNASVLLRFYFYYLKIIQICYQILAKLALVKQKICSRIYMFAINNSWLGSSQ